MKVPHTSQIRRWPSRGLYSDTALADLELGDKVAHLAQQNLTAPNIGVDWVTGIVEDPHTNPPWVR